MLTFLVLQEILLWISCSLVLTSSELQFSGFSTPWLGSIVPSMYGIKAIVSRT